MTYAPWPPSAAFVPIEEALAFQVEDNLLVGNVHIILVDPTSQTEHGRIRVQGNVARILLCKPENGMCAIIEMSVDDLIRALRCYPMHSIAADKLRLYCGALGPQLDTWNLSEEEASTLIGWKTKPREASRS